MKLYNKMKAHVKVPEIRKTIKERVDRGLRLSKGEAGWLEDFKRGKREKWGPVATIRTGRNQNGKRYGPGDAREEAKGGIVNDPLAQLEETNNDP